MNAPYPAEIVVVRRRRPGRAPLLLLLAVAAAVLLALGYPPRAHPHPAARQAAVAAHLAKPSAHPAITVTVGKAVYACTVPVKPKPKR